MHATQTYLEFVLLPSFERCAEGLFTDDDVRALQHTLIQNPRAGVVRRDGGGVRKIRAAVQGRGKSGSTRVLYLYVEIRERIYLLYAFAKNEQENLTPEQARRIRRLVAQLQAQG